jgi:hypothetical protein
VLSLTVPIKRVGAVVGALTIETSDSGPVPTMLGKPFVESTSIVGVFTTGSKVLAYLDARQGEQLELGARYL